ncbi:M66 family metalloprotease [Aliivibrio sp. 1S128]|uniref:M66 family metalloprotease n=1 Tax=Aliivibrio sp. 1S128 TaxID=1840085 RepID=UPI00080E77E4|nr:M66 family metalloprotease [Aliivibrio sp. 1S128]OCH25287.1 glycosyl transferase [Aliivibrio sp. 1S128]
MKKTILATLVAGAFISHSVVAQVETLPSLEVQTRAVIEKIHQLALDPKNIIQREDRRYVTFKGKEYQLNFENYPMFPLNDAQGSYSNAFPFIDTDWEIVSERAGFYLIHRESGVLNDDETGCYLKYFPASRSSPALPDGSYLWKYAMEHAVVSSDCGELTIPTLSALRSESLSDVGVGLAWDAASDAEFDLAFTVYPEGESSITTHYRKVTSSFYIGDLSPNTKYDVEITSCNTLGCDTQSFTFTTLPSRLSYNDSRKAQNHLSGNLRAHVNFAQTHTSVTPNTNDAINHPNLVVGREALLLVTPQQPRVHQLWVDVAIEGAPVGRFALNPPSALPDTDQPDNGHSKVVYSHHAWSLPLLWDWMTPGLSLTLTDNLGREGVLTQDDLVFAGAPELVIQNIDIGMLTEPRDRYDMINDMAKLSTDYFQKIPVSKLVMADYTPLHLRKVTLPNGKVYTKASEDGNPSWHGGDMREYVGKRLVSLGINNANFGRVDAAGGDISWPRPFFHITAHNSQGRYLYKEKDSDGNETGVVTSKIVNHGGSGGGGIVTLTSTRGNEWSHELGHNFGRGHNPQNASIHDMKSGWGWDVRYNRFIGNLHWKDAAITVENPTSGESVPPFANEFRFMREAMGGGENPLTGLISNYTLEHPIAARVTQDHLNTSSNVDMNSSTGFSRWDAEAQRYVESDTGYAKPEQQGVPVITVLGIYDPLTENASQIYPLIYSNYGNIFALPAPSPIKPTLEGWQHVANLTEGDRHNTAWQTMKVDGEWLPLCQFSYTNQQGDTANFVGYENAAAQICQVTAEMYWLVDGTREVPTSAPHDYQLLSGKGELAGNVAYVPTPELGEQAVCALDKAGTSHDGAGFYADGKCKQIDGVKHTNGAAWAYAGHQGDITQYTLTSQKQCQLEVVGEDGSLDVIALNDTRHNSRESNKFHVNLPMDNHPARISLTCTSGNGDITMLDAQDTPRNPAVDALKGPIIIGQDYGYQGFESDMPEGWFTHTENFDPTALSANDKSVLATLRVGDETPNVCRFPMLVNGIEKTLHGYVDVLSGGNYQCTGGDDITVRDAAGERPLLSEMNQFEWLSLNNRHDVGTAIKATKNSDANLCSLNRGGEWYGAGFINASGQCTQEPEVYWSNGNRWIFSNGYVRYTNQ